MIDFMRARQVIGAMIERGGQLIQPQGDRRRGLCSEVSFSNPFTGTLVRRMGVKMTPRTIWVGRGFNGITVVGKNSILDTFFGKGTPVSQVDPWYIGLINDSPTPTLSENDTLASHAGWSEWTSYSGNRKAWVDADAASKIKGTTTVSTFTMSAGGTINGILVCGAATGTSAVLWATGSFDTTAPVLNGDDLKITYGVRM